MLRPVAAPPTMPHRRIPHWLLLHWLLLHWVAACSAPAPSVAQSARSCSPAVPPRPAPGWRLETRPGKRRQRPGPAPTAVALPVPDSGAATTLLARPVVRGPPPPRPIAARVPPALQNLTAPAHRSW